jgi:hypothetical protein
VAVLVIAGSLAADAVVVTQAMKASTIAEIFVEDDRIRAELEIGLRDLPAFAAYLPAEIREKIPKEADVAATAGWRLAADGAALPAPKVTIRPGKRIVRDPITGLPIGASEELVIRLELEYPLTKRPRALTLHGARGASIGFVLYDRGLPVNDFRYLPAEATVDLDPRDPWYSKFRHRGLRRQFDAPMNAYLYIEPFEIRKEVVVRPRDLQQWVDFGIDDKRTIPVEMQAEIKNKAAEFLARHGAVTVDGKPAEFALDRVHFIRRSLRKTGVIDPPEELPAVSATLGVIFVHPRTGKLPKKVKMHWDLFGSRIPSVPAVATDEAGGMPSILTPDDPELAWENFLKNPTKTGFAAVPAPDDRGARLPWVSFVVGVVALACLWRRRWVMGSIMVVAAVAIWPLQQASFAEPDTRPVVAGLLRNMYRAFDFRGESVIYDALARSVSGDVLQDAYLQTRQALELQNQGGARVKVKQIELAECDQKPLDEGDGFLARCAWTVTGSVGHWGHIHQRVNRYDANVVIEPVDGAWKITRLEMLDEKRVE